MDEVIIHKSVPVSSSYDIVVCGGGPAGFIAAISAARAGHRTALIERLGTFGGTATADLVVPMSGFFHNGHRVVGGIAWELVMRLANCGAAHVEYPKGHVSFNPEYYKLIAQRMVIESGVVPYTNTLLSGCMRERNHLTHIIVESKNGTEALASHCFIDATGEADLCRMARVPMQPISNVLQPLTLCFVLEGVDCSTSLLRDSIHHTGEEGRNSCNEEIRTYLSLCMKDGLLDQFGGPWFNTLVNGNAIVVNVTRHRANAADRDDMRNAEQKLRYDMFTIVDLLRSHYPEFRACSIVSSGINAGVRETQRIKGIYTVTGTDIQSGRVYACPVARCAHPIDIHQADDSSQQLTPLATAAYLPHSVLLPQGIDNLIAAGRCISADAQAFASLRVQATMMATGESAGVIAALYCESHLPLPLLDEVSLQAALSARGVVL